MHPATRLSRPSRGIALLLAAAALALLVVLGCRTSLSPGTSATAATAASIELDSTADAAVIDVAAEHAQRQLQRQPLTSPETLVVAILAIAAAVATGLRYTISSVPDAGRATSGLRPPPLQRA